MISHGVKISITGGGAEEKDERWEGSGGPYIHFADAVHFDDCESYELYKQEMQLRVYRDVVMYGVTS